MVPYVHLARSFQYGFESPVAEYDTLGLQGPADGLLRTTSEGMHARQDPATRNAFVVCVLYSTRHGDEKCLGVLKRRKDYSFTAVHRRRDSMIEVQR
jgi:hypothetical protein